MKCPTCNAEMKPLLTGVYCPNEPHVTKVDTVTLIRGIHQAHLRIRVGDRFSWNGKTVEVVGFAEFEDAVLIRTVG